MARYAAEYWTEYAVSAETSEEIVQITVSFLRDETIFQRWCRLYQADRWWDDEPGPPRAPRLYYACLAGLAGAARDLTTEGADVNAEGGEYGNALQAASHEGNLEVMRLLLDNGADVNAEGGEYAMLSRLPYIKATQRLCKCDISQLGYNILILVLCACIGD
ncbi:uncharacterized protein FRV6_02712 [Fusarium oxysporum]|uniref:Uncharacterized protein n=1 Tax=Fusarium oxysporum TaxID=5507 RepID=A0A2H3STG9_FUSOX|nr:uncharacterized protein FRV6_02712 [Fusarium oxysporum]